MCPDRILNEADFEHTVNLLTIQGEILRGTGYRVTIAEGEEVIVVNPANQTITGSEKFINKLDSHLKGLDMFGMTPFQALATPNAQRELILSQPIDILDLPVVTHNRLKRAKKLSVKDLVKIAESEDATVKFLSIRNFGESSLLDTLQGLRKVENVKFDKSLRPYLQQIEEEEKAKRDKH